MGFIIFLLVVIHILAIIFTHRIASEKGLDPWAWVLCAIFFGILAFLIVAALPNQREYALLIRIAKALEDNPAQPSPEIKEYAEKRKSLD